MTLDALALYPRLVGIMPAPTRSQEMTTEAMASCGGGVPRRARGAVSCPTRRMANRVAAITSGHASHRPSHWTEGGAVAPVLSPLAHAPDEMAPGVHDDHFGRHTSSLTVSGRRLRQEASLR